MLGNPESLRLLDVLSISLSGICIVFLALGCLILAIKVLGFVFQERKPKSIVEAKKEEDNSLEEEAYAVLLSVVSEASGLPLDKFRVISIREIE